MWRTFLVVPASILEDDSGKRVGEQQYCKLPLPARVIDRIFDELDILDRCCLSLCSKALLKHASRNEHLAYLLYAPPSKKALQEFFERRLGEGWVGDGLRYCPCCGTFPSTKALRWRLVSEKFTRERSGTIADLWRKRRDDGWLRYWIERWCQEALNDRDSAASSIRREDRTRMICPRCAVIDMESNAWRRRISVSRSDNFSNRILR